jgi:CheY-like chemotaxis protein
VSAQKLGTILIVEDVEEISSNMTAVLNKRGHQVMIASNAEQAIQMAEAKRPAMILTDLDLPTFDKLLNLVRDHDHLKRMVVAIIDINNPKVEDTSVHVLADFEALDDLIRSTQEPDQV